MNLRWNDFIFYYYITTYFWFDWLKVVAKKLLKNTTIKNKQLIMKFLTINTSRVPQDYNVGREKFPKELI